MRALLVTCAAALVVGGLYFAISTHYFKPARALPRATSATATNTAFSRRAGLNHAIFNALPEAVPSNAQTVVDFRELPPPGFADKKDSAPLAPGLYKTEPYSLLVRVPKPLDEGMLIKAPSTIQFAMRTFEPPLRFEQVK
jgi:hypothetical protein